MSAFSPYSIGEADPQKWRPGEDIAAGAFVGIASYLFVEVNVLIYRTFKRRQGLYFWSIKIGSLGILIDIIGLSLKHFGAPNTDHIWPLYTLLMVLGWTSYLTAQSVVLYSRLHLVMRNQKIQRYVLLMILSTIFAFVIPVWVTIWPAYNATNHKMSSVWSPRNAIVDRYTQIGYTITESTISGIYIWSLLRTLKLKINVRQRRVMLDLIYVNVVVIAFDIIIVVLFYTNQTGLSHPIQNFSYILKLRLEFVVLNQLMAVAARGLRHRPIPKNRYYYPSTPGDLPSHGSASQQTKISRQAMNKKSFEDSSQLSPSSFTYSLEPKAESNAPNHNGFTGRKTSTGDETPLTQTAQPCPSLSKTRVQMPRNPSHQSSLPNGGQLKLHKFPRGERPSLGDHDNDVEDEEEDTDLHRWERRATEALEVPWFRSKVEA